MDDKLFEEILVDRIDKLIATFETLKSKRESLDEHIQRCALIEEMIDEHFSLFLNYMHGQCMLINKSHGNYDVIGTYDLAQSNYKSTICKLLVDYVVYSVST